MYEINVLARIVVKELIVYWIRPSMSPCFL